MSDVVNVFSEISSLDVSPQFNSYSKVVIHVDDETTVEYGNDSGRTLEFDNPFGTQAMAQSILASLQASGYQYQPYDAQGTILDPAAEIGDALAATNIYGGIYARSRDFGRLMKANVSAPHEEEINHEYLFENPQERKFTRQVDEIRASLIVAGDAIEASVKKSSGSTSSGFGWRLTDTSHAWYSNGTKVMEITASGLSVRGSVTATSGTIGGFTIGASYIVNGMTDGLNDTTHNGVYIGTNGIALGKGAFKVTSSGAVSANNMVLTGTLKIGGTNITAAALRSGAQSAYNNGGNWTSAYNSTSSGGFCYNGAVNGNNALNKVNNLMAGNITATTLNANGMSCSSLRIGGRVVATTTIVPGSTYNNVLYLGGYY